MLNKVQRDKFRQLIEMEDKYAQSWQVHYFIDTLETHALEAISKEPEFAQLPPSEQKFIHDNIKKRIQLEPKTATLTDEWIKSYPNLAERMADTPAKMVFVRAAEFCNCDYDYLAKHIEAALTELKAGVTEVKREIRTPWNMSGWEDRPRNRYCLTLRCIAIYTQRAMISFRYTFLRGVQTSLSSSREGTFITFQAVA